jgi:excisionase family DNA binding protein
MYGEQLRLIGDNGARAEDPIGTSALLKPSELAVQLGVSRTWLYDAARDGRIPSIRIGGSDGPLRFVPQDIQRWIDDARGDRRLRPAPRPVGPERAALGVARRPTDRR